MIDIERCDVAEVAHHIQKVKRLKTSSYTRNKSFAGSSLPAETKALRTNGPTDGPADGPTDGRTHPLIESWLTTKKSCAEKSVLYCMK